MWREWANVLEIGKKFFDNLIKWCQESILQGMVESLLVLLQFRIPFLSICWNSILSWGSKSILLAFKKKEGI